MTNNKEQLIQALHHLKHDAAGFVNVVWGIEPTWQQEEILDAISQPEAWVSVASGHGIGKSCVDAWIIFWFLGLNPDCRIPCTAPSASQLKDILWAECSKWHQKMHPWFRQQFRITDDHIMVVGEEKTRFAVAKTARPETPEALQGFHEGNLLFIIDEASGVHQKIFELAEGSLSTEGARILMTSNPTRTDGYFYDSHKKNNSGWTRFQFSGEDSPLVSERFIKKMRRKYGIDSNVYKIRVLGQFPDVSDDILIAPDWVMSAIGRDIVATNLSQQIMGVDIARYGDDSNVLTIRQGPVIKTVKQWRNKDLMETCGIICKGYKDNPKVSNINVDVIGLGAGVVDRLAELGLPVCGVNVAETASSSEEFVRLRDELWWKAREYFQSKNCRINPDVSLKDDLCNELTTITYGIQSNGKIKVESKDDYKKRGYESPNLADSLCMTFAVGKRYAPTHTKAKSVVVEDSGGWT